MGGTPAIEVREKPIIFNAEMVRAILSGRKTQTRRIVKPQSLFNGKDGIIARFPNQRGCPYGSVGTRLWVRETCEIYKLPNILTGEPTDADVVRYVADGAPVLNEHEFDLAPWWEGRKTLSSIHMPRWACRLVLEITDIRVERLQGISEEDAKAEGIRFHEASKTYGEGLCYATAKEAFQALWQSIHGPESWATNPWVWAIAFRKIDRPAREES